MTDLGELAHAARARMDLISRPPDLVARFTVAGKAVPKGSMRAGVRNDGSRFLYSDRPDLAQWTHDVFWSAKASMGGSSLVAGPVECVLDFVLPVPKTREGELWPIGKNTGDVDKLTRATLDGLTGSLWHDDSQVVRLLASKRYANLSLGRQPGVTIAVYKIPVG